ncbi:(+)-neomenthol dehydrogenase [Abeliophyllum distichum]|uniref:Short-chain dehydrogenase/reductase n=1 Tax=Abeliophyllum distichum TaxID=126358 RepID=A0ABD1PAK8_9LAMI
MAASSDFLATKRVAVVTGANKGIGLEICRQLVLKGVTVILTARDVKKGAEAVEKLKGFSTSDNLIFHQLDVADASSIAHLADFIKTEYGKLDILVNNAAVLGASVDLNAVRASKSSKQELYVNWSEVSTQKYELAEECLKINYYGAKNMAEALIPLLQLSDSPRIVNVSSSTGKLKLVSNERAKEILSDANLLTEERVDAVLNEFLTDFRAGLLEDKGWPSILAAYTLSKAAMNAYTRILAKKYPNLPNNSICPGYVKTDMNFHYGNLTIEEGAESPVWLALLPDGCPSGFFFFRKEISTF